MSSKLISRRQFLKGGCLTAGIVGLTACGIGVIIPAPDPSPIDLPSLTYGETIMNHRVLIAYASHFGSTGDIAAAIGETLSNRGLAVDVKPIKEVCQINEYQALLLGSAVQYGTWLPEAIDFVKSNRQALNHVPVALFTVHITNLGNDETSRKNRMAFLEEIRPLLTPVDEVFFAGKFDRRGAMLMLPGWLGRFW